MIFERYAEAASGLLAAWQSVRAAHLATCLFLAAWSLCGICPQSPNHQFLNGQMNTIYPFIQFIRIIIRT
jgi:hypothetical protein